MRNCDWCLFLQLGDPSDSTLTDDEDDAEEEQYEEEEEEDTSSDKDEETTFPGDSEEEVSTVTRAKQMAERLKATAWKVLWDLRRILAISFLALAGKICVSLTNVT